MIHLHLHLLLVPCSLMTQCQSHQRNVQYMLETKFPHSNYLPDQARNLQGAGGPAPEITPEMVRETLKSMFGLSNHKHVTIGKWLLFLAY